MTRPTGPAAFFDVDETLINVKSMFDFLAFRYRVEGRPESDYARDHGALRRLADGGVPREEVNRAYYRLFTGVREADLAEQGEQWYRQRTGEGELFHAPALAAFRRHTEQGHHTVLVSGSFPGCLDPIARYVDAGTVLCSRPLVADGILTGELERPMIGAAKAVAARELLDRGGFDPRECHAYGDHSSDLDLLRLVGHPTVVGDDPVLTEHADRGGWSRLPGLGHGAAQH
ncbi:HAD family hydrolase [Kitasatospora sp. NPDC059827]|uniref:HAD family hydrolase n=1 Tax=Kitasatospora sp. NPDC059827 TaxID=3346964 RepID=UPI00364F802B